MSAPRLPLAALAALSAVFSASAAPGTGVPPNP